MLIILVGKTCSGKTVIRDELNKLGYKSIITTTTRPMRLGEINGVTYDFISEEEFKNKIDEDYFIEYTSYNVADGSTWYYGTPKSVFNKDGIIILNPAGIKNIPKSDDNLIFYISCPEDEIRKRLFNRGDNIKEATRRMLADRKDFEDIENFVNYIVYNDEKSTPKDVAELIIELVNGENDESIIK